MTEPAVAGECARQCVARAVSLGLDRRDGEFLIQWAAGRDRAWFFTHGDSPLDSNIILRFERAVARRLAGDPVAYIMGAREFWSLPLTVNAAVLIPRPDTELLVQWAVELIGSLNAPSALDLGTGSGAIALALKSEYPELCVTAVDASAAALAVARSNGVALKLGVEWLESDWFEHLSGRRWPLVVANPPYIRDNDPHLAMGDLPAEPRSALASGPDGLHAIRCIIDTSPEHLHSGGWLLLEHGWDQGGAVRDLLASSAFVEIQTRRDLAGHERVTGGRYV